MHRRLRPRHHAAAAWLLFAALCPAVGLAVPPPAPRIAAAEPAPAEPAGDVSAGTEALRAQQLAAEATEQIADWTAIQVLVTSVGSALLLVTITLTYRATRAAEAQVIVAQETAKQELRAYMSLAPDGAMFETKPGGRLLISVGQQNNGQTPAKEVRLAQHIELLPHPLPPDYPFPQTTPCPGTNVVHPDTSFAVTMKADILPSDLWNDTEHGAARRVYVFLRLTYLDAFGEERETRACWWHSPKVLHDISGAFDSYDPPKRAFKIPFEYADQHNTAD